ncbi:hypothetical protein [Eudoraea sp.]|uniref:hypothetical protein n=1 Tax=Eudoraea sp. TaxID=1979955 RepID=UPI003C7213F6
MKKFFPLVLLILLFSCSSDDNGQDADDNAEAYFGTWVLVESNVNPPLDANDDGTTSRNLLDEVECLTGTIVLNDNFRFTLTSVEPIITAITGDLYIVSCSSPTADLGLWTYVDDTIVLEGSQDIVFEVSGNRMTFTSGLDLPEVQSIVYEKQ